MLRYPNAYLFATRQGLPASLSTTALHAGSRGMRRSSHAADRIAVHVAIRMNVIAGMARPHRTVGRRTEDGPTQPNGLAWSAAGLRKMVPRGGIEPPTRGFS